MHRKVTSHDVARAAGVSRATVSYVLDGRSAQSISPATRQRVLKAAQDLGYTPSAAARTLRRGRSDLVLMLLPPEPLGRALAMVLDAASDWVERQGLRLIAHRLPSRGGAVDLVRSLAPAALILIAPLDDAELEAVRATGIPVATLQGQLADPSSPDLGIGGLQITHLAAAGHRRIGVAVPADPSYGWRVEVRLAAIREACDRLGLPNPKVEPMSLSPESAAPIIGRWRQGPEPVTAACGFDDEYAFALLAGLAAHGLSAPADLAVIGAEDIPLAGLTVPPLTTVRVDARRLGERFAQLATAPLAGSAACQAEEAQHPVGKTAAADQMLPPATLVRRGSV
ncbi:LacI family DNA-binding transcriptional regulator [Arthrobacter sp.]|uniref:LacI family DNA-binding transcriptional regulator n=1 Tax=Arthrobacter sp. TaxID=1667 RepID=UPI0028991470|nr:LacI family DNA-binding transcriptional regulator [Arthrobacter sp.]